MKSPVLKLESIEFNTISNKIDSFLEQLYAYIIEYENFYIQQIDQSLAPYWDEIKDAAENIYVLTIIDHFTEYIESQNFKDSISINEMYLALTSELPFCYFTQLSTLSDVLEIEGNLYESIMDELSNQYHSNTFIYLEDIYEDEFPEVKASRTYMFNSINKQLVLFGYYLSIVNNPYNEEDYLNFTHTLDTKYILSKLHTSEEVMERLEGFYF